MAQEQTQKQPKAPKQEPEKTEQPKQEPEKTVMENHYESRGFTITTR